MMITAVVLGMEQLANGCMRLLFESSDAVNGEAGRRSLLILFLCYDRALFPWDSRGHCLCSPGKFSLSL